MNISNVETAQAQVSSVNLSDLTSTQLQVAGAELGKWLAYDALNVPKEINGTRLVKMLYKADSKTGLKLAENSCSYIPTGHLTEETVSARIEELAPYLVSFLQEIEDKEIKVLHKTGASQVYTDYLSLDKIIEALEASEIGARLTKEKIEAWFDADLADSLILLFGDKLGVVGNPTPEQEMKINSIVLAYRAKFSSLAGGKTFIKEADCAAMILCLQFGELTESTMGRRFIKRLENMTQKEEELLLSL
jgi:hypothetical protein